MRLTTLFALSLATSAACATDAETDPATDEVEAPDDDGKVDSASELSVRVSDTTLWISRTLERRDDKFVLRGRTSRNLVGGREFIFDDVYGEFFQRSPRVFEVEFDASTGRTVVDGVNLFTNLSFAPSSSRPSAMVARVVVRPRVASSTGPSSLALTAELAPIVVAGHTVYRLKGRSTKAISTLATTLGVAAQVDPNHFTIDLDYDQLNSIATPDGELAITATLPTGPATIRAKVGLVVKKLGLTTKDVSILYPVPSCTAPIKSCLTSLPDGALDLATCGEAIAVRACHGQLGVVVDAPSIAAATAASDAQLATLAADAPGLVGADRAADLGLVVHEVIAGRLAAEQGVWLLSATARAQVLARATGLPLDEAYAYPFSFVDGHEAAPGNVAATRHVAADAVLSYLRTQDYVHSELGRSYFELTQVFRAQHVATLRAFRETSELVTFPSMPGVDYYVGDWIGLHTEVTIARATGEATHVLVEID